MYLRSLRIKGFKSFPLQTELVFEPGVAVIIGPNGSGKSNVSDAITWVLGEQSPSTIRGTSMQDVIFAGSDGRRASGSAEVELTFDNGDGALSVPTPEVSIGRRVQRGGETTYLINRSPCRLADVLELTAEMGLGRELHAIVGQGRVESLLASKPVERRALIEEAAGLGVYKRRRERAEIKLREVRRNLERARDLEKEAASQLAPLRRQANAAELRRSVEREIAEARGSLLTGELEAVDARLAAGRAAIEQVAVEKEEADARLAAIETERLADEETFTRDLQEREQRAARALRARYLADRLASTRRLIEQRLQLVGELERAALAEREGLAADAQGTLVEPAGDAVSAATSLDTFEEALAAAEAAHEEASGTLAAAQADAAAARSQAAAADLEREGVEARLARLRDRRAVLSDELERAASESGAAAVALEEAAGAVALAQQRAEGAGIAAGDAEAAALASDEESAAALKALGEAEASVRSVIAERAAVETELEHAEAALRELRDVGDDVLQVMEQHPGATALTSALSCEPGYEAALGAALAQFPGAVAVGSGVDQWGFLSALRTAGVRLVRLVLARPRSADTGGFPGAVRLLDKVSVEGDADLESLLADVVIVEDLRAVADSFTGLAVTRDGAYYRPATGQLGLAAGLPAAVLVERRAKTAGLRERLDALKAREAREVVAAARARTSADALAAARAAAAETLAAARREAAEAGHALTRAQAEGRIAAERRERLSRAVEAGEGEVATLDADVGALEEALTAGESGREPRERVAAEAGLRLAAAEAAQRDAVAAVTLARIEFEERKARADRAQDERRRAARRAEHAAARIAQIDARLERLPALREVCGSVGEALGALAARLETLGERARAEADEAESKVRDRSAARRLADEEAGLRRAVDDLGERRAAAQVEIARADERRTELAARFDEVTGLLETAVFTAPAGEAEAEALRASIERLERRREGIGAVNPLAEAECERLQEHLSFLREQTRDLEQSVAEIETLIAELTGQIEADFEQTFETVGENFAHMVGTLFPGGSGRLVPVAGETPEEPAGIAIEVKPARKLGKKLGLLSGGERALVALAFLLALLLSKTAPFYILDEVEAALDDINIGLFVSLVREYRTRTQFIVITHQKRTMEAADVLYGVTMGPDGTSQVVSARMAEDEIDAEAARG